MLLVVPQMASASLLLTEWYAFAGTAPANINDQAADTQNYGFSGSVAMTKASQNTGGSTDQYFGGMDSTGDANLVPTGATANGALALAAGGSLIFTITNTNTVNYVLEALQFDAAKISAGTSKGSVQIDTGAGYTDLNTKYIWNEDGEFQQLGVSTYTAIASAAPTGADYTDLGYVLGMTIEPNQTISFKFTLDAGSIEQRIDNLLITGLTAIPEPGSWCALGCLVGSGALLRTRRRRA